MFYPYYIFQVIDWAKQAAMAPQSGDGKESCRIPADDESQKLSLGSRKSAHIQTTLTFTLDNLLVVAKIEAAARNSHSGSAQN